MSENSVNGAQRLRLRLLLSSLTLTAAVATSMAAPAAHADENVTCTLQRSIKVKIGGSFVPIDAGAKIKVKVRMSEWSAVDTPEGPGVTATKILEQQCKPLPARPPEPVADDDTPAKPPKLVKKAPTKAPKPPRVAKAPKPPKSPRQEAPKAEKPKTEKELKATMPPIETAPQLVTGRKGPPLAPGAVAGDVAVAPVVVAPVAPVAVAVVAPVAEPVVVPVAPVVPAEPVVPVAAPAVVDTVVAPSTQAIRVAVRQLDVDAASAAASSRLRVVGTAALEHEVAKLVGVSVIDLEREIGRLGADGAARLQACGDDACIANIASALGADELVIGGITSTATGQQLQARRLTVLPLSIRTASAGTAVNDEGTVRLVGAAVDALFPERVRREGAVAGALDFVARLDPPPVAPPVTIAVGGVAIAGAAVAVVATVFNQLAYSEGQRLASSSSLAAPADGAQLASIDSTVQTSWRVLTVASISAAALAVTAGVLAVFTDWQGLADEPPPATPTSTITPPG